MRRLSSLSRSDSESPYCNFNFQTLFGRYIFFLSSVTSTNDAAMELAQKGLIEGTVIVADTQTHGRGRLRRTWHSPKGVSLYFTVILRPGIKISAAPFITLMAAVAVVQTIREFTSTKAAIKWPNDILVNGRKLGGILTETKICGGYINVATLGIGLNVNLDITVLPVELRRLATSLFYETGEQISRFWLLDKILQSLETWYRILLSQKYTHLIQSWKSLNITLGRQVRVETGYNTITGKAIDIGKSGELIVQTDRGNIVTIVAADVSHCRF